MTFAIISEYNPFHNGHKHQIDEMKKSFDCDHIVAVMSGNFVQRGEPALISKYKRVESALKNGIDIVLELPFYFSVQSAEGFARGAVHILNNTGIVDALCFGSESGDVTEIKSLCNTIQNENDSYKKELKELLSRGYSYPKAKTLALESSGICTDGFLKPNNILAIEYLRALNNTKSKIIPFTIKRHTSNHNSAEVNDEIYASSSAIRQTVKIKRLFDIKHTMPGNSFDILNEEYINNRISNMNRYNGLLRYIIAKGFICKENRLTQISEISEGLDNRIINKIGHASNVSDLIDAIKSKRYTRARIQRCIINILLDLTKDDVRSHNQYGPEYIRVLGFKRNKDFLLRDLMNNSKLPVITNLKNANKILDDSSFSLLQKEAFATELFKLSLEDSNGISGEFNNPLVIV